MFINKEKHLQVYEDYFCFKDTRYSYDTVKELAWLATKIEKRTNFVRTGEEHNAQLIIYFDDGSELFVQSVPSHVLVRLPIASTLTSGGEKQTLSLLEKKEILYKKTLNKRYKKYRQSLAKNGYFTVSNNFRIYGDPKLTPHDMNKGDIIWVGETSGKKKDAHYRQTYNAYEGPWYKTYNETGIILFYTVDKGKWWGGSKTFSINITIDTDLIHFLLADHFIGASINKPLLYRPVI